MTKKTIISAIASLAAAFNETLAMFGLTMVPTIDATTPYKIISSVIALIVWAIGWYYNNPTSKENSEHTGLMRTEKQLKKINQIVEFIEHLEDEEVEDDDEIVTTENDEVAEEEVE